MNTDPEKHVISIDIGSTYTKGALISVADENPAVVKRAAHPTTVDHLPNGALQVFKKLVNLDPESTIKSVDEHPPVYFSSSAKGGLKVAVLGLTPELSLQIGRLVAWSAGARISCAIPYGLNKKIIKQLEDDQPDILLFCGGTDGGNEKNGLTNAKKLAKSNFAGTIIYAGNSLIQDEIEDILKDKKVQIVSNVMPDIGRFEGTEARAAIQAEFLRTIIEGKGLTELVNLFGTQPSPTPRAVLELVKTIASQQSDWNEFVAIDMGGATTDVYSHSEPHKGEEKVILRGIMEPVAKRSVEGDLGMRISSASLYSQLKPEVETNQSFNSEFIKDFDLWVDKLQTKASTLPKSRLEEEFDRLLATGCIRHAVLRHAGQLEQSWTPAGKVWLQRGKDLRPIKRIVLTGGYAANNPEKDLYQLAMSSFVSHSDEKQNLIPETPACYVDQPYLWPLLGNLAPHFPEAAAKLAVSSLNLSSNEA
jgi:uncharacterized protein (TIGR01319 family)